MTVDRTLSGSACSLTVTVGAIASAATPTPSSHVAKYTRPGKRGWTAMLCRDQKYGVPKAFFGGSVCGVMIAHFTSPHVGAEPALVVRANLVSSLSHEYAMLGLLGAVMNT